MVLGSAGIQVSAFSTLDVRHPLPGTPETGSVVPASKAGRMTEGPSGAAIFSPGGET